MKILPRLVFWAILVVNWVSFRICLFRIFFFLSASSDATYIFTAPTCTITKITLENCALNAETFSISYSNLIKFPCFADTTERGDKGWKQDQRQGEDMVTLWITLCVVELHWKPGLCASRVVFYLDNFVVKQLRNFGKFCFSSVSSPYFCTFGKISPIVQYTKLLKNSSPGPRVW